MTLPPLAGIYGYLVRRLAGRTGLGLDDLLNRRIGNASIHRSRLWSALATLGYSYSDIARVADRDTSTVSTGAGKHKAEPSFVDDVRSWIDDGGRKHQLATLIREHADQIAKLSLELVNLDRLDD